MAIDRYGTRKLSRKADMKNSPIAFHTVLFLVSLLGGCRSTPVPPAPGPVPYETGEPDRTDAAPSPSEPVVSETSPLEVPASTPPLKRIFPESLLNAPEKDSAPPALKYDTVLAARTTQTGNHGGWLYRQNRQKQIVGFEFSNRGGNRVLPPRHDIARNLLYARDFQFSFDDRARQDVYLMISDWVASRDKQFRLSELMNSILLFFPRNYLPAVAPGGERNIVTLPTGEEVEFDAETHEIIGGVFSENPVDLNPDRIARRFPGISYLGKGVMVRTNARGKDPRLAGTAIITTGSPAPDCHPDSGCNRCEVPARELWAQNGAARFRFSKDDDFHRYLLSRCGFGLPAVVTAQQTQ